MIKTKKKETESSEGYIPYELQSNDVVSDNMFGQSHQARQVA